MNSRQRFLAACLGEPVDRPPIWMMRQAGRFLPEYRALRDQHGFLTMVKTPDVATEITLQPVRRFGVDAAILFSDILTMLEPFGLRLKFEESVGPSFDNPVRSMADVERMAGFDSTTQLGYVAETLKRLKTALAGQTALIGFAGAPLTLAIYAIEGKTTKEHHHFKKLLFSEPETVGKLIDLFAAQCADYLAMQVRAGADAVQIFDTWGGTVDPENYRRFVEPSHRRIIEAIKPLGVPIILFVKGGGPHMDRITESGADVVGLDWTLDMGEMAERYGRKVSLQGNLDPTALLAPPQRVAALAQPILEAGRKARGHIFNLGHGVLQMTPVESAAALVKAVGEFRYA